MKDYQRSLKRAGLFCFGLSLFQAGIGFSPSLSLYFGAPETLVQNYPGLIITSLLIAGFLALFGLFALSGAGLIQRLPALRPALVLISLIFLVRGLLILPELLAVTGLIELSIPMAMRFVFFSGGSLLIGLIFARGTIAGWPWFPVSS
ncbi:hypothetical protein [Desulfospira joergensenii]|uniref:hypothetical protein n=1 Tax=Desulfospira joergensenii TaxID=53329 RepID=UPI0003B486C2|nr:hypothetical protein [Desulfospira joergensenii]